MKRLPDMDDDEVHLWARFGDELGPDAPDPGLFQSFGAAFDRLLLPLGIAMMVGGFAVLAAPFLF